MAANKGLGRGLGSLLGIFDEEEKVEIKKVEEIKVDNDKKDGVVGIDMALIDNNPNQPRKNFDANAIKELAQSIKEYGVIQPIILKPSFASHNNISIFIRF